MSPERMDPSLLGSLAADPQNQEDIVRLGAGLEEVVEALPPQYAQAHRLLASSLGVLQVVYEGMLDDPVEAMGAIAQALVGIEQSLDEEDHETGLATMQAAHDAISEIIGTDFDDEIDEAGGDGDSNSEDDTAEVEAGAIPLAGSDDEEAGSGYEEDEAHDTEPEEVAYALDEQDEDLLAADAHAQVEDEEAVAGGIEALFAEEPLDDVLAESDEPDDLAHEAPYSEAEKDADDGVLAHIAPAVADAFEETPQAAADALDVPPPTLPTDTDMDLLREYVVESMDHMAAAEASLLTLEANPEESEEINVVFRGFHTIKGTSGFLGLDLIQHVAHLAENLLDRARDGEITLTGGYADLALRSSDALKHMISGLQNLSPGDRLPVPEGIGRLLADLADPSAGAAEVGPVAPAAIAEPPRPAQAVSAARVVEAPAAAPQDGSRVGDLIVAEGAASRQAVETAAAVAADRGLPLGEALVDQGVVSPAQVSAALRAQAPAPPPPAPSTGAPHGGAPAEGTVRVATGRLDSLINMVGELVIAHSMVAQDPDVVDGTRTRLARSVAHTGKILRELQDLSMSLRMVPLKATFQKMTRLVRDVARKSGKQVQFVIDGEETEIDRNMVEVLNDPLVHLIRNAVDHGVETPQERLAAGKPETGVVHLSACHSAGNVVISLRDDGKGLDREKIIAKALERDLIDPSRELSDSEVYNIIFLPGFSTAEKVTDVSGRGVGTDVVRKSIEALRGRIEVTSELHRGTTFTLRLPLTMAITDAMLLKVGDERYLLPTASIEQSFRPTEGSVHTIAGRGEMVSIRGELLPIFRLHRLFGIEDALTDPYNSLLIAIEVEGKRCVLMVDDLLGQQQVVVKSLGDAMADVSGVAGGAILGDGRVGLILDTAGILRVAYGEGKVTVAA